MLNTDFYRKCYPELKKLSLKLLINHWIRYGKYENRLPNYNVFINKFPDFNVENYKKNNVDLIHLSDNELIAHYWSKGHNENRSYKEINLNLGIDYHDAKIISNNHNKILVVMPTYNRPYSCINVIKNMINQTCELYDLLIIDDGSTVNNYNEIKKFVSNLQQKNIILQNNIENLKIPKTLNIGLKYFLDNEYKYFTWISDDNVYYKNFLSVLLSENADFCYTNIEYNDKLNGTIIPYNKKYDNLIDLIDNFRGIYSYMWSRDAIKTIGMYNENLFCVEDLDYFIRTFIFIKNIKFVNTITMKYVLHNNSLYNINRHKIDKLAENIKLVSKILTNNSNIFIYYSKIPWSLLFQRPHQICRFFDIKYIKVFITNENIIKFEEKHNLLIIPYDFKEIIFNLTNKFNEKIIYYTDSRLCDEISLYHADYKILFDLIDAPIDEFSFWKPNLAKTVETADCIIYSHPDLVNFLKDINNSKKYHYVSNGCDYEHFSKANTRLYPKPFDIPITNKPILGYYGAFGKWLDYDLIRKYATEGKYHILMIGGIVDNPSYNIRFNHPNVTWLNHKSYDELPIYLSWFDVCFLPFKECELTKYVNPCKLWEYMASKKEIIKINVNVSTDIDIVTYNECCDKIKNIINNESEFIIFGIYPIE